MRRTHLQRRMKSAEGGRAVSVREFYFGEEANGKRIDHLLMEAFPDYSRTQLRAFFEAELVQLEGRRAKAGEKYKAGQCLSLLALPDEGEALREELNPLKPCPMKLDIRYEDEDLLVVNKPQGLVVHPAVGHWEDTLVNGLLYHYGDQLSRAFDQSRPGILHRIDKDTSGLLIIVKSDKAHKKLSEALQAHEIKRSYLALAHGQIEEEEAFIDAPIARSKQDRQKMCIAADGRVAQTDLRVLQRLKGMTLLDLALRTGRTHQIRVHLNYIKHPVVGDPLYAGKREAYGLKGQALHAYALEFIHPTTGELLRVQAELPQYFQDLIEARGGNLDTLRQRGLC